MFEGDAGIGGNGGLGSALAIIDLLGGEIDNCLLAILSGDIVSFCCCCCWNC